MSPQPSNRACGEAARSLLGGAKSRPILNPAAALAPVSEALALLKRKARFAGAGGVGRTGGRRPRLETLAAWKAGVEFTNGMRPGEAT